MEQQTDVIGERGRGCPGLEPSDKSNHYQMATKPHYSKYEFVLVAVIVVTAAASAGGALPRAEANATA